jgi:triosephosphate isomerase
MNKTQADIDPYVRILRAAASVVQLQRLLIFPPLPLLAPLREKVRDLPLRLGSQTMHWKEEGAYTGEVSYAMLSEMGATCVLIGHSERRMHSCETDEIVNLKVLAALQHRLTAVLCIGESLEARRMGLTAEMLRIQLTLALQGVSLSDVSRLVIAYEPIWAIGTGETASTEVIQDAHRAIRALLDQRFTPGRSDSVAILYGGSVSPKQAPDILSCEEVDGALVGNASLSAESLLAILCCLPSPPTSDRSDWKAIVRSRHALQTDSR